MSHLMEDSLRKMRNCDLDRFRFCRLTGSRNRPPWQLFGGNGLVDPGGVTGGVAWSLVATAIGLIVAVFALFEFNYFSRRLERLMDELELFANARLNELRLKHGARGKP
ncbi:MotA/TolQ/ExbB proton channel family protein [Paraburkholderia phymatum]|uniref:MotA/TolQ/ExbB proton channel family protein n=1 Tax=Paraburkholderia phymatum TaxID=148447 RepID=UPI003D183265